MDFSIAINLTTNAWNVTKFMATYIMLDTLIPILLESIDKATIVSAFSRHGRVPVANFTKDRHARSGLRKLVDLIARRFRNRPFSRKSPYALTFRTILLLTIWIASFVTEYDSGSQPNIKQVETAVDIASRESLLHAMFTCVQIEHGMNFPLLRTLVRDSTMTREGLKCSCSTPTEVGCTMPVRVEPVTIASSNILFSDIESRIFLSSAMDTFSSNGPLHVTRHKNYILVQARGKCNICSPNHMGPVDDILYSVYASLVDGALETSAVYTANLTKGTLVGLAAANKTSPFEPGHTLNTLFRPSNAVSFLQDVWERPDWQNRVSTTIDLARMLQAINGGSERSPEFSAIWTAWWLRGGLDHSQLRTVTLNASSTETATISLLGIVSFSYVIGVFLILLLYNVMRRKWTRAVKTNGYGNVEWLISALIAQQQLRGSSLRGVDDFEQFDLTVVEHNSGVHHVSAQHWIASLCLASPTRNLDVIDGKTHSDKDEWTGVNVHR